MIRVAHHTSSPQSRRLCHLPSLIAQAVLTRLLNLPQCAPSHSFLLPPNPSFCGLLLVFSPLALASDRFIFRCGVQLLLLSSLLFHWPPLSLHPLLCRPPFPRFRMLSGGYTSIGLIAIVLFGTRTIMRSARVP